jgi:aerobic-type carbon monoxide dehydrogenase small subunit (CoxS/CutS family)
MRIELQLNGRAVELDCGGDEMLVDLLRREGLDSVRVTCGIGVCGACTVHGREVTTVEGLDGADPVQRAFIDAHAFQCGWCTPGFVLTAKALLAENPSPSDREIVEALGGNLCRCGSYVKITQAVQRAASELATNDIGVRPNKTGREER